MRSAGWVGLAGLCMAFTICGRDAAAAPAPPESPKVSTYAPAEDLAAQLTDYVDSLEKAVATEAEYKDSEGKVGKEANTVVLIALALGLHDTDNKYKAGAPSIIKAAQELAATKDFAAAKKGVAALKAAVETPTAGGTALKWEKVASLPEVMKQVPTINTKMKMKLKRLAKNKKEVAGHSAVLAVIAQGSMADTSEAKNDTQVKQWYDFCVQMRSAAAAVNKAAHEGDQAAATEGTNKALQQSCDDCHAVFHPTEKK